jgi:hypothetical protein
MTLPRFLSQSGGSSGELEELLSGSPTILAFARLCGNVLAQPRGESAALVPDLTGEAEAILCAAGKRGILEIKGTKQEVESPKRLLAVYVEVEPDCFLVFRNRQDPQVTLRFLDGFRQLCEAGFIMHQMGSEFSLTRSGFEQAAGLEESALQEYLEMGYRLE